MGFKSETLQHAAFIFDRNLNTNVTIIQDQPKPEFASRGATRQESVDLSKILQNEPRAQVSLSYHCVLDCLIKLDGCNQYLTKQRAIL